jgi:hypothetical protein
MTKEKLMQLIKDALWLTFQDKAHKILIREDDRYEVILWGETELEDLNNLFKRLNQHAIVEGELVDLELIHEDTTFRTYEGNYVPVLIFSAKVLNMFARGGKTDIVGKTMSEFKRGKLRSSSGEIVTDREQAIAIGLSKQRRGKFAKGGMVKINPENPNSLVGLTAWQGNRGYLVKEYDEKNKSWFFQWMSGNGGRMIRSFELDDFEFYKPKFLNNPTQKLV